MPEEAGCPSDSAVDRYVWQPGLLNKRETTALGVWSLRLDRGVCALENKLEDKIPRDIMASQSHTLYVFTHSSLMSV